MQIRLTKEQYDQLLSLEDGEVMSISYKGIDAWLEKNEYGNIEYKGMRFLFNFYCPSEVKMSVANEPQQEETEKHITFIGAEFDPKKMHPYDVKTHGKHPVHLVEGGEYITEDDTTQFDACGDMGWFWLNEKEYQYYKSQAHEIRLEVR